MKSPGRRFCRTLVIREIMSSVVGRTLPTLPRLPGETLPEFPAIVKNNSSSAAPPPQVEQLSTIEEVEIKKQ